MWWQWHQLDHMKSKSSAPCSRQTTTPAPHHSVFTAPMLFLTPSQQCQNTEGKKPYLLLNMNRTQAAERAEKCRFLSLVTLTFDLDLQTRPSEGQNTSSMSIWRKSVHRFPRYFIHKRKTQTDGAKNRTFRSSLRAAVSIYN